MKNHGVVVITGATRGLGRAMVEEFIRHGWVVAGCGRNAADVEDLCRLHPAPHHFAALDVRDDSAMRSWAESLSATVGVPDLLLNNAAVIHRLAPLWELSAEEFDAVIDTNIKGVANVIRHFVPRMIQRRRGVIVNFSSGWGRSVDAQVAPYCATKWAIEGMTRALAEELPNGLAAVALNPGIIHTDMLEACFGSMAKQYPSPAAWARSAVPFLLKLGPADNGKALTAPTP
ncbi:MAG: SDR family NAD(P)-dependent oxidoreductase [Verrucomicrobiota bacterium]|nr:SDR family NAD(P)-dependent oxidoreductase [Limisphaera sp.]MDW8381444.1 SDR family NAD(P)-dependent oxidoreductase [Verrucomicrobiota bacterium]